MRTAFRRSLTSVLLVMTPSFQRSSRSAAGTAAAFSTTTATATTAPLSTATSDAAKQMAANFEVFQLAKLKEAGLLGVKRPFTISAQAVGADDETNSVNNNKLIATKVIHFQRHGQGYHNLMGEMFRELHGRAVFLDETDPAMNPFIRPEILDSPLTEKGRAECVAQSTLAATLNPELVVVSPLHRAIQTAVLSFSHHLDTVKWMAHEDAREQHGFLYCNKRRSVTETQKEFPHVDFSALETDEDAIWLPEQRESPADETARIYKFLTEFIMERSEQELAVIGHSAWLFSMCNAVMDCGDNAALKALFRTSEIRSMRVSFYKTDEAEL